MSGCTSTNAVRQLGQIRAIAIQNSRSRAQEARASGRAFHRGQLLAQREVLED